MSQERRLHWVQRNRSRADRVRPIAALVQRLAEQASDDGPLREVAAAVAEVVDDEFRAHCRVAQVRGRMALIHVDQASLVSAMQMRWLAPLTHALCRGDGHRAVSRIAFAYGKAGVGISLSPTEADGRDAARSTNTTRAWPVRRGNQ